MPAVHQAIILGAGMVGVSSALALQARGVDVAILERGEPGRETSYGNAGLIQSESAEPYPVPRGFGPLWRYALGLDNAVRYRLSELPGQIPALWRYFVNSEPARHRRISDVYHRLTGRATADHAPLIRAAGAGDLINPEGFRQVWRTRKGFDEGARNLERLKAAYGISGRLLDEAALKAEEPALKAALAGGIHWPDTWSCSDPGELTAAYARLFQRRGGTMLKGDASSLRQGGAGWVVSTKDGPAEAEVAVAALGPWTPGLLERFGYKIAMVRKRGYHRHYAVKGSGLSSPVMDTDASSVICPMRAGLRITTGAHLTALDGAPDETQMKRAEAGARELLEFGAPIEERAWFGMRPCLPDMLPIMGEAPRHKGLWIHFGHGHHGFTLGPTTGELMAEALTGEGDPGLLAALSPARLKKL